MEVKKVRRELAQTQIDYMIFRLAFLCTGGKRSLTTDELWLVDKTINTLMDMFTGYTIAAEE